MARIWKAVMKRLENKNRPMAQRLALPQCWLAASPRFLNSCVSLANSTVAAIAARASSSRSCSVQAKFSSGVQPSFHPPEAH